MTAKKTGTNSRIRLGGASLAFANTWDLTIDTPTAEATPFGASFTERAPGIPSWSGTLTEYFDQDSNSLFTYATSGASYLLAVYSDYNDATTYWSGQVFLSGWKSGGKVGEYIVESVDFVGASTLAGTGFS